APPQCRSWSPRRALLGSGLAVQAHGLRAGVGGGAAMSGVLLTCPLNVLDRAPACASWVASDVGRRLQRPRTSVSTPHARYGTPCTRRRGDMSDATPRCAVCGREQPRGERWEMFVEQ